jgi:hypothetical protein
MLLQHFQFRRAAIAIANLLPLMCAAHALAQDHEVLCTDGNGTFQTATLSGVTVKVGATKSGGLSTRTCEATLAWNKQPVTIATNAAQIDLDAFNIDLGLGTPIAAFQVKSSADQCCMEYKLYSLERPPRLLRTLTGADYFTAADTDLDGRVEIWTSDALAVNGLEKLSLAELEFPPTVVLRFEHGDLHDVSSEFQPYYDNLIAALRKQLSPSDLQEFKNTDGKLSGTASPAADQLHHQWQSKIKVLEIAWSFL